MKKASIVLSVVIIFSMFISACSILSGPAKGSGNVVEENRSLTGFTKVTVGQGMALNLVQTSDGVKIKADDNLIKYVKTEVVNGELIVEIRDAKGGNINISPSQPIQVNVTITKLEAVTLSGGSVLSSGLIKTTNLNLNLSGGSAATIERIDAESMQATLSGGSSLTVNAGKLDTQTIDASGASIVNVEEVKTTTTSITMSGGGEANIWVLENLTVDLSGGAMVYYYGSPANITEKTTSGGSDYISRGTK